MREMSRQHALLAHLAVWKTASLVVCQLPMGQMADGMHEGEVLPRQQGEKQQQLCNGAPAVHFSGNPALQNLPAAV